jgi:hypothetical protein
VDRGRPGLYSLYGPDGGSARLSQILTPYAPSSEPGGTLGTRHSSDLMRDRLPTTHVCCYVAGVLLAASCETHDPECQHLPASVVVGGGVGLVVVRVGGTVVVVVGGTVVVVMGGAVVEFVGNPVVDAVDEVFDRWVANAVWSAARPAVRRADQGQAGQRGKLLPIDSCQYRQSRS